MSVQTNVFMHADRLAHCSAWAALAQHAGFPLGLRSDFDLHATAPLPLSYEGVPVTLGYRAEHVTPAALEASGLLDVDAIEELDGRHLRITLTSESWRGLMCAMVVAAALTELSDGVLAEGGCAPFIPAPRAVEWAHACRRTVEAEFSCDPTPA